MNILPCKRFVQESRQAGGTFANSACVYSPQLDKEARLVSHCLRCFLRLRYPVLFDEQLSSTLSSTLSEWCHHFSSLPRHIKHAVTVFSQCSQEHQLGIDLYLLLSFRLVIVRFQITNCRVLPQLLPAVESLAVWTWQEDLEQQSAAR